MLLETFFPTDSIRLDHTGPEELEVSLSRWAESRLTNLNVRYFISCKIGDSGGFPIYHYLHSDGILYHTTKNKDNQSTGWFETLSDVDDAISKYIKHKETQTHQLTSTPLSLSEVSESDNPQ